MGNLATVLLLGTSDLRWLLGYMEFWIQVMVHGAPLIHVRLKAFWVPFGIFQWANIFDYREEAGQCVDSSRPNVIV